VRCPFNDFINGPEIHRQYKIFSAEMIRFLAGKIGCVEIKSDEEAIFSKAKIVKHSFEAGIGTNKSGSGPSSF
jgi:hypothetical protein